MKFQNVAVDDLIDACSPLDEFEHEKKIITKLQ